MRSPSLRDIDRAPLQALLTSLILSGCGPNLVRYEPKTTYTPKEGFYSVALSPAAEAPASRGLKRGKAVVSAAAGLEANLTSEIERRIEAAGFELIPMEARGEADVLFEVKAARTPGRSRLEFFQHSAHDSTPTPVSVQASTAARCQPWIDARAARLEAEGAVIIEATDARSGARLWSHRGGAGREEIFFKAGSVYTPPPAMPPYDEAQKQSQYGPLAGVLGALVGAGAFALGYALYDPELHDLDDDDDDDDDAMPLDIGLMSVGTVIAIAGLYMWISADYSEGVNDDAIAWNKRAFPPPTLQPADAVLCQGEPVTPPWAAPAPQAGATSYVLGDSEAEARGRLLAGISAALEAALTQP